MCLLSALVPRRVSRQPEGRGSIEHAPHVGDTADIPLGQIALEGRGKSEHAIHVGDAGEVGQVAGAQAAQVSAPVEIAPAVAQAHAAPLHDVDQLVAVLVFLEPAPVWLAEAEARHAARDAHGVEARRGERVRGGLAVRGATQPSNTRT